MISTLSALKDSLLDKPQDLTYENEVRHKLLIDYSEDESLLYLLFKFGIIGRDITRIYCLSKLPGDKLHKVRQYNFECCQLSAQINIYTLLMHVLLWWTAEQIPNLFSFS